jgi:hypothetical protein
MSANSGGGRLLIGSQSGPNSQPRVSYKNLAAPLDSFFPSFFPLSSFPDPGDHFITFFISRLLRLFIHILSQRQAS